MNGIYTIVYLSSGVYSEHGIMGILEWYALLDSFSESNVKAKCGQFGPSRSFHLPSDSAAFWEPWSPALWTELPFRWISDRRRRRRASVIWLWPSTSPVPCWLPVGRCHPAGWRSPAVHGCSSRGGENSGWPPGRSWGSTGRPERSRARRWPPLGRPIMTPGTFNSNSWGNRFLDL